MSEQRDGEFSQVLIGFQLNPGVDGGTTWRDQEISPSYV